jgi:hypothetical protein
MGPFYGAVGSILTFMVGKAALMLTDVETSWTNMPLPQSTL